MSTSAIQNTPITINLVPKANDTGWSIIGTIAQHESCNTGNIQLIGYTIVSGKNYQISYRVLSISGGYVQPFIGTTAGVSRTASGDYIETISAVGISPILYFKSNANCQIQAFNINDTVVDNGVLRKNTIVYSPVINKWTSYFTFEPDYGFSMFIRTLLFKNGIMYRQQNGSASRNTFFGTDCDSFFQFVDNKNTTVINHYQSLSIQANQLIITSNDGIQTSFGQLSTLIDTDFEQQVLTDGPLQVDVYDRYGVYMASFVNDSDGDQLNGNYLIVQLQSTDSQKPMQIYTVDIRSSMQKIGAR
jgi:hypothetical protein